MQAIGKEGGTMQNKEKEKPPILYEKYKRKHLEPGSILAVKEGKAGGGFFKTAGNLVISVILLFMTALSAVGSITLLQSELRQMLMDVIRRGI